MVCICLTAGHGQSLFNNKKEKCHTKCEVQGLKEIDLEFFCRWLGHQQNKDSGKRFVFPPMTVQAKHGTKAEPEKDIQSGCTFMCKKEGVLNYKSPRTYTDTWSCMSM